MRKKTEKGFTLIELLVVIAIIGLLSSVVMASLNQTRAKARDARRMSDIQEINKAIQLYIADNDHAPYLDDCTANSGNNCYATQARDEGDDGLSQDWDELGEFLVPNYISELPRDPFVQFDNNWSDNPGRYGYYYAAPASTYSYASENNLDWSESTYILKANKLETTGNSFTVSGLEVLGSQ